MISERPRDAAIRTLPVVALDHGHVVVRIEVVLHMESIPPREDLVAPGTIRRVHAPPVETVLERTEGGVL